MLNRTDDQCLTVFSDTEWRCVVNLEMMVNDVGQNIKFR